MDRPVSFAKMREIMTNYYLEAKTARDRNRLIAWITSGGPVEPLIAMDIIPVYPENHGAMIGAAKMGAGLCEIAEQMGYSMDLCSYARSDIACSTVKGGPIGGLPAPDMLVCCNNICGTVLKWYEIQARYYNAPLFILDTPFCHTAYMPEVGKYVRRQIQEYIAFLEEVSGRQMDRDRLEEVGKLSLEGQKLWQAVLDTAMYHPSPISAFDAFFYMALIVTLRGTSTVVNFYTDLLQEMEARAREGKGVVAEEKYRLLWDNIPIWYRMKWLADKFAAYGACLVADTYTSAWCSSLKYIDEEDFLNSMAEGYTRIYLNIGIDERARTIMDMAKRYDVCGVVMHSNRSCKPYSLGQYDIQTLIEKELAIPTVVIEADMVDERSFSEAQIETRIEAFMELLVDRALA